VQTDSIRYIEPVTFIILLFLHNFAQLLLSVIHRLIYYISISYTILNKTCPKDMSKSISEKSNEMKNYFKEKSHYGLLIMF
jgi:hypothetical protein